MVFSSIIFIFAFLPITLILYYLAYKTKNIKMSNVVLLIASMFFYAWGGVSYLLVLVAIIIVNWFLVILMSKSEKYKSILMILTVIIDVGNLFYFKYLNFFTDNLRCIANLLGKDLWRDVGLVVLPIGISFYTFQIISYVVDVYWGNVEVQKDPVTLALYIVMFPQLIAGPIVRYKDINNEINRRIITNIDVEDGIKRFIIGFSKKVFIANQMGNIADVVFAITGEVNTLYAWIGAVCYTLQIYYDFSAYSDMAIGIGRVLGFHFNENFIHPYRSVSIQEFWRRWHISLSSWFRDYIYIPLGGNRKGKKRTYINLLIVFLLTGFWHGAEWQFVLWGLYHGFFIVIERLGFKSILEKTPSIIRHIYTMIVVIVGWVWFRADNLSLALNYLKNMFSLNVDDFKNIAIVSQINSLTVICFVLALLFSFIDCSFMDNYRICSKRFFNRICYLSLWIASVLYLTGISYNPFIYFKF